MQKAIFAGGCFWCMVMPFDAYDGVVKVVSGYTGGLVDNPTYSDVKAGMTDHLEAVLIEYDEQQISYEHLLDIFWRQIDPTDDGGQFGDRGNSYRTAIFYINQEQKVIAETSIANLAKSKRFTKPLVTQILPAGAFYTAEDYHQDYARRTPEAYAADKAVQERKAFLKLIWENEAE